MNNFIEIVANTNCSMNLINEFYLLKILSNVSISQMPAPVNVRGIGNVHHECNFYVMLDLFLNGTSMIKSARGQLHREIHIVKNLKCKLLLKMNILKTKQINLNMLNKIMTIPICKNLMISIRITPKSNARIKRIVHSKKNTVIFVKTITKIPTYLKNKKLSNDKNFLFELNQKKLTAALKKTNGFYIHVCDCNLFFVQIRNDLTISVIISRRSRLSILIEYEKKECYQIESSYHEAAIVKNIKKHLT